MIKEHMKPLPRLFKEKEDCCGCTACYAICPRCAISMIDDEEGFLYPIVDENSCIRCYQCLAVCPMKESKNVANIPRA